MHSTIPPVVCWGMGQDSTGMLVGMWERGTRVTKYHIRPQVQTHSTVSANSNYVMPACGFPRPFREAA